MNPVINQNQNIGAAAKRDIVELEQKIQDFQHGTIPEDKFKHFRLTRGVYGQRQLGVQMIRIKLPHGRISTSQLSKIAEVSDKYATGNLHLTTRQDIQLHYVKLALSPALWAELEKEDVTLREACGNTVRNVTASADAGVNKDEPFDVTPYAKAFTDYFLRNPICQDMGRKIKVAFSSGDSDSAFTYFHDLGFIARIKEIDGNEVRGFKVVIGGGLGAQSIVAKPVYEFLPVDQFIPFSEAVIRVFDRYGERAKRFKARMKFLIQKIGLENFLELVEEERRALKNQTFSVDATPGEIELPEAIEPFQEVRIKDPKAYENWLNTNVFAQKQEGFYGIKLRVTLGDIHSSTARKLAVLVKKYGADDLRVTVNQGLLLRYFRKGSLPLVYEKLEELGLAKAGFDSTHDITACPGTDTCNLAVTNSTGLSKVLEDLLHAEFPELIHEQAIKIKISGCMNSCGQHMAANIGFHGSSIKNGTLVAPAMQVVIGGGVSPDGTGFIAEKVVKVPTKRTPDVVRTLLSDFRENGEKQELFNDYFQRHGKMHFYQMLKPLAGLDKLEATDYSDWGQTQNFQPQIGVGECAGVTLDVVGTVISEALEKLELAKEGLADGSYADSIYNSYSSLVIAAKALLLSEDHQCNTQVGIVGDFQEKFIEAGRMSLRLGFDALVYQIKENEPGVEFAQSYLEDAQDFLNKTKDLRQQQVDSDKAQQDKQVIENYYKA